MEAYKWLSTLVYGFGSIAGILAIIFTYKIYKFKLDHAKLEEQIAKKELESLNNESSNRTAHAQLEEQIAKKRLEALNEEAGNRLSILHKTNEITQEISHSISEQLIKDPSWLDRFMDQTGVTYSASVYGKRIGHFFYEKSKIAKEAIATIQDKIKHNQDIQYCLIIDSGTTMYPVFQEIANMLHDKKTRKAWQERVCIVTNNIPGIQYLMKNGKENPLNEYSEIALNCFVMPGKPLSVYAAITGIEAVKWLGNLHDFLNNLKDWRLEGKTVHTIGFVTGNYIARQVDEKQQPHYFPVARGEGHVEIKEKIVEMSDEIFLLSPLMKFTFANVDLLNTVNGFDIERTDIQKARQTPNMVKYKEIAIQPTKLTRYFTSSRPPNAIFFKFSQDLFIDLKKCNDPKNIRMPEFNIRYWTPSEENSHLELEKEIPHTNLRKKYEDKSDIWDMRWVLNQ